MIVSEPLSISGHQARGETICVLAKRVDGFPSLACKSRREARVVGQRSLKFLTNGDHEVPIV